MKQNPFSLYDFFGYLIPGAVLIYLTNMLFSLDAISQAASTSQSGSLTLSSISGPTQLIIISYLSGHVLAILSSAIIETYDNYSNGYPSEFLFGAKPLPFFSSETKLGNHGRFLLATFIIPITALDFLSKKLQIKMLITGKKLPDPLRTTAFKNCATLLKTFNTEEEVNIKQGIHGDLFRLIYHFVYENSERHAGKLQNYVALYGFTRNTTLAFILSFWCLIIKLIISCEISFLYWAFLCAALSYIFYLGFAKFYRRFTLEALMAASVYRPPEKQSG